jgi:site-specific DNA recombinase
LTRRDKQPPRIRLRATLEAAIFKPQRQSIIILIVAQFSSRSSRYSRVPAGEIEAAVIDQLRAVFRQPEIVAGTWKAARAESDHISEPDARVALQQLDPLWDELFPAEQARIVALLVERVDVDVDGLNVRLRLDGLGGLAREMLSGDMGAAA